MIEFADPSSLTIPRATLLDFLHLGGIMHDRMRVSNDTALQLLDQVNHSNFRRALHRRWEVFSDGRVKPQSVMWLFCWAKTGQNSATAAEAARNAFNEIVSRPFAWYDARVPHAFARRARYSSQDIAVALAALLR